MSTASTPTRLDATTIKDRARGKWREILSRLGIDLPQSSKQHGPCPACGGKDRFRFDDQEGKGTWFCNQCQPQAGDGFKLVQNVRGCAFPDALQIVADALGYQPLNGEASHPKIIETYDYTDAAGALLFQVVRFIPKDFRQRRPDGHGGWIWNLKDLEPVLYKLPHVLQASSVLIVEGEKDVETAHRLGLPDGWAATCNPMGAGKWRESYAELLAGKHVVILPDADAPGQKHAEQMAQSLQSHTASVARLTLLDGAKDLSAWAETHTAEELRQLLAQAAPWTPLSIPDLETTHTPIPSGMSVSVLGVWPDPKPVRAELLPVNPLPLEIIPAQFRPWIHDVSSRMQCPPDFVAAGMLVMTGAIIGAGCGIRPKKHDDWTVTPNLWGAVVGRPSMLKTPAISEAMKPIEALEIAAKQQYDEALKGYAAEAEAFKAQREALKSDMLQVAKGKAAAGGKSITTMDTLKEDFKALKEPLPPVWQRYKANDATIEKMGELQADNPRGILLFRDELIGLFSTWDRENHESDRAFYLEGWNGTNPFTWDRIGRGSGYVKNLCVSLFGGIQPTKLGGYLYAAVRGQNNDGLVQRLQVLVYPDEPPTWTLVDTPVKVAAKQAAHKAVQTLAEMDFKQYGAFSEEGNPIPYFRFAEDAQGVFNDWLTGHEHVLRSHDDEPVIAEHLGKYRSLMPSLALIFHLVSLAGPSRPPIGQVSRECALQAAAWCEYLESHARRVYGMVTNLTEQAAARLAGKLAKKETKLPELFTVRDVYRKEWSLLTEKSVIENACDELVSLGWLREIVTPSTFGQKGKTEYVINPKVRPL